MRIAFFRLLFSHISELFRTVNRDFEEYRQFTLILRVLQPHNDVIYMTRFLYEFSEFYLRILLYFFRIIANILVHYCLFLTTYVLMTLQCISACWPSIFIYNVPFCYLINKMRNTKLGKDLQRYLERVDF